MLARGFEDGSSSPSDDGSSSRAVDGSSSRSEDRSSSRAGEGGSVLTIGVWSRPCLRVAPSPGIGEALHDGSPCASGESRLRQAQSVAHPLVRAAERRPPRGANGWPIQKTLQTIVSRAALTGGNARPSPATGVHVCGGRERRRTVGELLISWSSRC